MSQLICSTRCHGWRGNTIVRVPFSFLHIFRTSNNLKKRGLLPSCEFSSGPMETAHTQTRITFLHFSLFHIFQSLKTSSSFASTKSNIDSSAVTSVSQIGTWGNLPLAINTQTTVATSLLCLHNTTAINTVAHTASPHCGSSRRRNANWNSFVAQITSGALHLPICPQKREATSFSSTNIQKFIFETCAKNHTKNVKLLFKIGR